MPTTCAVADCNNSFGKKENCCPSLGQHRFPLKNKKLLKSWVSACKRRDAFKPANSAICSEHFMPDDFERDLKNELLGLPLRKILKKDVLPTIFKSRITNNPSSTSRKERADMKRALVERKQIINDLLGNKYM